MTSIRVAGVFACFWSYWQLSGLTNDAFGAPFRNALLPRAHELIQFLTQSVALDPKPGALSFELALPFVEEFAAHGLSMAFSGFLITGITRLFIFLLEEKRNSEGPSTLPQAIPFSPQAATTTISPEPVILATSLAHQPQQPPLKRKVLARRTPPIA